VNLDEAGKVPGARLNVAACSINYNSVRERLLIVIVSLGAQDGGEADDLDPGDPGLLDEDAAKSLPAEIRVLTALATAWENRGPPVPF
jgi:hypothetical protein